MKLRHKGTKNGNNGKNNLKAAGLVRIKKRTCVLFFIL